MEMAYLGEDFDYGAGLEVVVRNLISI